MLLDSQALEVQTELERIGVIPKDSEIELYNQIHGGADTTIFEIGFKNHSTRYVQRIFRPSTGIESSEFEYTIQKTMFENGLNVPETFLIKHPPNAWDRTYFIMKKIEGRGINDILENNPEKFEEIAERFMLELHKIHSINPDLFPQIPRADIQKDPFAVITKTLRRAKATIEKFHEELAELRLVVDWLEENKSNNPCEELVVIHSDYHPFNIIVEEDGTFQILDWTGINISDYRRDLGFSIIAISAGVGIDQVPKFQKIYEKISGKKVENLEYFMVLASVYNLMRFYSGMNNPSITNETEDTMAFFKSISDYPLFVVELVKRECGIDLKQIKNYFG